MGRSRTEQRILVAGGLLVAAGLLVLGAVRTAGLLGGSGEDRLDQIRVVQRVPIQTTPITVSTPEPDTSQRPDGVPPPEMTTGSSFDPTTIRSLMQVALSDLLIDMEDIQGGAEFDAIQALIEPERLPAVTYDDLWPEARVLVVRQGAEVVAYSIDVLAQHEIVNDVVGDVPLAITYCPLCDSVVVFNRQVMTEAVDLQDDEATEERQSPTLQTLTFGVSGLLAHGNVLLFDRSNFGLWSQLGMECVSGPLSGTSLSTVPFELSSYGDFQARYPQGQVMSLALGHRRDYSNNPYASYFDNPNQLLFAPRDYDTSLAAKVIGAGLVVGDQAMFITRDAIVGGLTTIPTNAGPVTLAANEHGITVRDKPDGVQAIQTYWFAWSAFHPDSSLDDGSGD